MKKLKAKFKKALFNYFQDEILDATKPMHTRTEIKYEIEKLKAIKIQAYVEHANTCPFSFTIIKAKKKLFDEIDKYIEIKTGNMSQDGIEAVKAEIIIAKHH